MVSLCCKSTLPQVQKWKNDRTDTLIYQMGKLWLAEKKSHAPGLLPASLQHQYLSCSLAGARSDFFLMHCATHSAANPLNYSDGQ